MPIYGLMYKIGTLKNNNNIINNNNTNNIIINYIAA